MRCTSAILVVLCLAAPAGLAEPLLTDASGDVRVAPVGQRLPGYARLDLQALEILEEPSGLKVVLGLASVSAADYSSLDTGLMVVAFDVGEREYRVQFNRPFASPPMVYGELLGWDFGADRFVIIEGLAATVDAVARTLSTVVPWPLLEDEGGRALTTGSQLTNIVAWSEAHMPNLALGLISGLAGSGGEGVSDVMPDAGAGATLVLTRQSRQSGSINVTSPTPLRSSNGEAGAFVFPVKASNSGVADLVKIQASNVPEGWEVILPHEELQVPEEGQVEFDVVLVVPFAHRHGTIATFDVVVSSLTDPESWASLPLGIRYTQIPQPSGHHDTLFIRGHALGPMAAVNPLLAGTDGLLSMNTVEPAEASTMVTGLQRGNPGNATYLWYVHLEPSLQVGLEFDMTRLGEIRVPFELARESSGMSMSGRLLLLGPPVEGTPPSRYPDFGGRSITELATIPDSSLEAEVGEGKVVPSGNGLVPFLPAQNLVLELRLSDRSGLPTLPDARIGSGWLRLPLHEYSDPIDNAKGLLSIDVKGGPMRQVNPGDTAWFEIVVRNNGPTEVESSLEAMGPSKGWVTMAPEREVRVPAGEVVVLPLRIQVPAAAVHGERADIVLRLASDGDPSLFLLTLLVDEEAEHEFDGLESSSGRRDAALVAPGALLAIAVALFLRRKL